MEVFRQKYYFSSLSKKNMIGSSNLLKSVEKNLTNPGSNSTANGYTTTRRDVCALTH